MFFMIPRWEKYYADLDRLSQAELKLQFSQIRSNKKSYKMENKYYKINHNDILVKSKGENKGKVKMTGEGVKPYEIGDIVHYNKDDVKNIEINKKQYLLISMDKILFAKSKTKHYEHPRGCPLKMVDGWLQSWPYDDGLDDCI